MKLINFSFLLCAVVKLTKLSINTIITYMSLLVYKEIYIPRDTEYNNISLQEIKLLLITVNAQVSYAGEYVTYRNKIFKKAE